MSATSRPTPDDESGRGHSEDYFGGYRDFWWNADFVALMARRLGLPHCRRILDAGCGMGHWTRVLVPHLTTGTAVTGVDTDAKWASGQSNVALQDLPHGITLAFERGDVCALPFADACFDCVTCQTLLIHVPDPRLALAEMLRVLAPGGLLLCVEPDNFGIWSAAGSVGDDEPVEHRVEAFRFALVCERGRVALGRGNASIGGRLPRLFAALGVQHIAVHLSDKAVPLYPPYDSDEQRATVRDIEAWYRGGADFSRDEALELFTAGGGDAGAFEVHWQRELGRRARTLGQLRTRRFDCAGGVLMYLVSGRKG
jgi:SAM-dependent methyltransferase